MSESTVALDDSSLPPTHGSFQPSHPLTSPNGPHPFTIGRTKLTVPLISEPTVSAHLRLLGAFHRQKCSVSTSRPGPSGVPDPPRGVRWHLFVHQAVSRFQIWLECVVKGPGDIRGPLEHQEIPPLDVLLVWHAYLLNPFIYADDTRRTHRALAKLEGMPLEQIANQIDPETLQYKVSQQQVACWESKTLEPQEPVSLSPSSSHRLTVKCPRCSGPPIPVPWLCHPYLDATGYAQGIGWCQNRFSATCPHCQFEITRESIAVGRYAMDIAKALVDEEAFLPGTPFNTYTGTFSLTEAKHITTLVLQPFADCRATPWAIGDRLHWSFAGIDANHNELKESLDGIVTKRKKIPHPETESCKLMQRIYHAQIKFRDLGEGWNIYPRLARMLASYRNNPGPFSIDLVGAVIRQTSFTSKVYGLGWLNPLNPNLPLAQSITRYHQFLHILSSSGNNTLVPTLDIDLSWHTHQLSGSTYMDSMYRHVGRYINHDDKIEEEQLSNGFDMTSKLWQMTFLTPYAPCNSHKPKKSKSFLSLFRNQGVSESDISQNLSISSPDLTKYPFEDLSTAVPNKTRITWKRAGQVGKRTRNTNIEANEQLFVGGAPLGRGNVRWTVEDTSTEFGFIGLEGWALLGEVDVGEVDEIVLDTKTVAKDQRIAQSRSFLSLIRGRSVPESHTSQNPFITAPDLTTEPSNHPGIAVLKNRIARKRAERAQKPKKSTNKGANGGSGGWSSVGWLSGGLSSSGRSSCGGDGGGGCNGGGCSGGGGCGGGGCGGGGCGGG